MKKVFSSILGVLCLIAIMAAGAQKEDGSCDVKWSLSCMIVAAASGWGANRLDSEKK